MKTKNLLLLILCFASVIQTNPSQKAVKYFIPTVLAASTGAYALYKIHENTPSEKPPKNQYELALDIIEQRQNSQNSIDSINSIKANLFDPKFNATNKMNIHRQVDDEDEDNDLLCHDQFCGILFEHEKSLHQNPDDDEAICNDYNCALPHPHKKYLCDRFCK